MGRNSMRELEKFRQHIYNCKKCGVCVTKVSGSVPYVCPVRERSAGFDHYSSRGKIVIAQALLEGVLAPSPELAEALFSCTLCGNCMTQCGSIDPETGAPLVDTAGIVHALRADLVREHPDWVDRAYRSVLAATRQYSNPWGKPRATKQRWTKGLGLRDALNAPADVLLFTGCTIPSNPALSDRARKAVRILQAGQVDFAVLGKDEPCCGSVQRNIGDIDLARALMEENIRLFNSIGCKTIVTLCAGCYKMLKKEYKQAEIDLEPQVYHLVEFVSRLIRDARLPFSAEQPLRVGYHDPCHLGRQMGVFAPPREILSALPGIELVERAATKENTLCCGAGGGLRLFQDGSLAGEIGAAVLKEVQASGADALVSACPFCEMHLAIAAQGLGAAIPIYDIIDLVSQAIPLSSDNEIVP
jgi:glycolate oxidase